MDLEQNLAAGRLRRLEPSRSEIGRLLAVADRDIADASLRGLSADRAFSTAYSAALSLATLVLRASGYRTSSDSGHHWLTIGVLPELMGPAQRDRATYLDTCRRSRNQADYDMVNVVSKADVVELLNDCLAFRNDVLAWLKELHPELMD